MHIKDWNKRWQHNQIGFHLDQPNPHLTSYLDHFNIPKQATIFVPLCGKSLDVFWLAQQGYHVVGIECSPVAVSDFFKQHQIEPDIQTVDDFTVYQSHHITLYQGDFFKLNQTHLKHCDLIYDRASLIAFSSQQRAQYISHLKTWFSDTTQLFLITLNYDQNIMDGPPFAVSNDEVTQHFKQHNTQVLQQIDVVDEGPRWRKVGLSSLIETTFKIQ